MESRLLMAAGAAYFVDAGSIGGERPLPKSATLDVDAGRRLNFSAAALRESLPSVVGGAARQVTLPTPDGGAARFLVRRTQLLAPDVAAAHPEIATYSGVGVDDPTLSTNFDLTTNGFHATVFSDHGDWAIAPVTEYAKDVRAGRGGYASFRLTSDLPVICEIDESSHDDHDHDGDNVGGSGSVATGPTRLTVRLAAAANGEWVALAGGTATSAFSAIVSKVNYAEGIYNREFNIGFTLVSGTNLVYTDAATDPYTNTSASTMLGQNQTNVDAVIGSANYDIGHVFTTSGGGIATLGVVGQPGSKARGVTGNSPNSSSSQFTFTHEMGHQFNSHHTWNYAGPEYADQRSPANAYEPGPGSTILSYGGFGFPGNFVSTRDEYFHARSIDVITTYITSDVYGSVAGTRTSTGNAAPTVNAGVDRTIPTRTPFELTGSATDNGPAANLTYTWEQYDLGDGDGVGVDDGDGPLFRSRRGTNNSTRSFPELADVLANRIDNDEYLPTVGRTTDPLTFRLTVRDGLGGVNVDAVDLVVQDTGAPFAITSQNATGTTWQRGSTQTVTWDVAGTTAAAFNAANVAILISYNGGTTFSTLLASTANDGSATVTIPADATITSTARIKIKPVNNVFYDINNANISVTGVPSAVPGTPDLVAATDTGTSSTDNVTNRDNSTAGKTLQFSVSGTVSGATVSIYAGGTLIGSAVASGTTTTVTTSGAADLADGTRSITARQTEPGKMESTDSSALSIVVDTAAPTATVTAVSPDPRSTGVSSINVVFNQAVAGVDLADFTLTRGGGSNLLTAAQSVTTGDNITYTVNNLIGVTMPAGAYVILLTGDLSGITDVAGNAYLGSAGDTWTNNNVAPAISSLSDSPDPVAPGAMLTLTAGGVTDANGSTLTVNFYRESNGVTGLQLGQDTLLGADSTSPYALQVTAPSTPSTYTYYARVTDSGGLSSGDVSTTSVVQAPVSVTPGPPELLSATDTGVSDTDNITNRDNSTAAKTLQFSVNGTVAGATVTIYSGATAIGSAVASGATTIVTTNGTTRLSEGFRTVIARQTEPGKGESSDSFSRFVTIDATAPTADVVDVSEPRTTPVASIQVNFSETVSGFDFNDLRLTRDGVNVPLSASNDPFSGNGVNWLISDLSTLTTPGGTYVLTVVAAGITDAAGNQVTLDVSDSWVNGHALPTVTDVFVASTAWSANFFTFLQTSGQGDSVAGFRLAAADHADELPWVNLNKVSIKFSENVDVAQDDLVIRGVNVAAYPTSAFTYDAATFVATWTLTAAAFANDKILLDLDADAGTGVTDSSANPLDGEWTNPASSPSTPGGADTFPSGDGSAGGDFRFRINVLPGDVNRSGGSVIGSDVTLVRNAQNFSPGAPGSLYSIFFDVNGSASILGSDVTAVRNRQGLSLPAGEPAAPAVVVQFGEVQVAEPAPRKRLVDEILTLTM